MLLGCAATPRSSRLRNRRGHRAFARSKAHRRQGVARGSVGRVPVQKRRLLRIADFLEFAVHLAIDPVTHDRLQNARPPSYGDDTILFFDGNLSWTWWANLLDLRTRQLLCPARSEGTRRQHRQQAQKRRGLEVVPHPYSIVTLADGAVSRLAIGNRITCSRALLGALLRVGEVVPPASLNEYFWVCAP